MIKEVAGDILPSKAGAIAHGIAPHDDFKQGLALSLREQWPGMYRDFRHYCQTYHPTPGTLWAWKGPGSPIILNQFTQDPAVDHHGRPGKATVPYLNHVLQALKRALPAQQVTSLALPRLATGIGGLSWDEVKPLISQSLGDVGIPVFVYTTFKKEIAAAENVY